MPVPAVAAVDRSCPPRPLVGLPSSFPVAPAEAAGGRDNLRLDGWRSPVEPYRGWMLYEFDERDGDGFSTTAYFARGPHEDVFLNVSRFRFDPTDTRFRWLIDNSFGHVAGSGGSLDNDEIDRRIAQGEAIAAALQAEPFEEDRPELRFAL